MVYTGRGDGIGLDPVPESLRRGGRVVAADIRRDSPADQMAGAGDRLATSTADIADPGAT